MQTLPVIRHNRPATHFALALLFATYVLFSLRTLINPDEAGQIVSAKRLLASGVGAVAFWLIAVRAKDLLRKARGLPVFDLSVLTLAAIGAVLASRIGYDVLFDRDAEAMVARNVRWVIAWSGFFLATLIGYRALLLQRAIMLQANELRNLREEIAISRSSRAAAHAHPVEGDLLSKDVFTPVYDEADPLAKAWSLHH